MIQDQDTNHSRFGVFGDFPTRVMTWVIGATPRMPFIIEAFLLYFFTFVVFIFARQQRESIRANLKVIYDDLSFAEGYVGAFTVFRNFGWAYIDSIRARLGQEVLTWEMEGEEENRKGKETMKTLRPKAGCTHLDRPLHEFRQRSFHCCSRSTKSPRCLQNQRRAYFAWHCCYQQED